MKPQPPVTKMRIAPRTSSARKGARADSTTPAWSGADQLLTALDSRWMFWLILGLSAILRIAFLGIKPPHFDEGINGWFVDQMVKNGFYRYDPTNYHGPLHFYILFLSQTLFGRNIWALRMPVVLASIGCVWLALRFEKLLPPRVARLAALAMAVSPGFVFYGRYSIHEVWLVLFSMLFFLGFSGLWREGTAKYLWCAGMGLAGMILTKETYIIHLGCAVIAIAVTWVSTKITPLPELRPARQKWDLLDAVMVALAASFAIVFFYSGTFFNWAGVKDLWLTFHAWFKTGHAGNGHEKDDYDLLKGHHWLNYYWIYLMARYEWPALLGLIACAACQFYRNVFVRYLAIYGVGVLAVYSYVHYKTPWCIINIAWPFLFLFGAAVFLIPAAYRMASYVVAGVALVVSFGYCVWLNYFRCTTDTEPYVYVQTYNDIYKLTDPVITLAHRDPAFYHMTGHIIRPSPYPLPWILDDFPGVGYYEHENLPPTADADFLLVEEAKIKEVESKLHDSYYTTPLTIRPYQDTSKLYLRASTFHSLFSGRSPDLVPATR